MQLTSLLFAAALLAAGEPDTLDVAMVTAEKGVTVSAMDTILINDHEDVTDVLMRVPGIQLSDMGGIAGLKTVSLRGLGTAHTSVYIDGIKVSNLQSGQSDLEMIGMENIGSMVIDYAQNSLNFSTAEPAFHEGERFSGKASFAGGSFGTYVPAVRLDFKLSEKVSLSANASATLSKGDFPYIGTDEDGASATLRRSGNDISRYRGGIDVNGDMNDGEWRAKAYISSTDRGTPGSLSWPSTDRQKDMNAFVQGSFNKSFSPLYTLRTSAKVAYDDLQYQSSWGDSRYEQKEIQLNTSHEFRLYDWWKVTGAIGGQADGLKSGNYMFPDAGSDGTIRRYGLISAIASSFSSGRLKADLALEYSGSSDSVPGAGRKIGRHAVLPSASIQINIFKGLKLNTFGRRAYRTPMFNELYYIGYGNENLRPEDAWLTDLGLEWKGKAGKAWNISAKTDFFSNWLKDKITSAPSEADPNIWLPYNIGKVRSTGVETTAGAEYSSDGWRAGVEAGWTYQNAVDKTPDSYTYGQQIPYVARHSVTAGAFGTWKGWSLRTIWNLRAGRSDSTGALPDWNTLDASLSKTFSWGQDGTRALTLSLTGRNLTDTRYELSRGYPMPGRSIMGGITMEF